MRFCSLARVIQRHVTYCIDGEDCLIQAQLVISGPTIITKASHSVVFSFSSSLCVPFVVASWSQDQAFLSAQIELSFSKCSMPLLLELRSELQKLQS